MAMSSIRAAPIKPDAAQRPWRRAPNFEIFRLNLDDPAGDASPSAAIRWHPYRPLTALNGRPGSIVQTFCGPCCGACSAVAEAATGKPPRSMNRVRVG